MEEEVSINENRYSKLFNNSIDALDSLMRDKSDSELSNKDVVKIKAASMVINSYPRYRQAQAQVAHVTLMVLEGASESKEQYRELIKTHMPRVSFLRSIPEALNLNRQTVIDLEGKLHKTSQTALSVQKDWQEENAQLRARIHELENNKDK